MEHNDSQADHHALRGFFIHVICLHQARCGVSYPIRKIILEIFTNQKKLGIIPQDAKLTPWPDDLLKKWDTLSADEKKMFIRQVEVFAAYVAYTDHEIGRVIQTVQDIGKLDNTLIIFISYRFLLHNYG